MRAHKRAVIVVGSHFMGKSRTINRFVKPNLGIKGRQQKFELEGRKGAVLSQSREEAHVQTRRGLARSQSLEEGGALSIKAVVRRISSFDLLILAARPRNERPSFLIEFVKELRTREFVVHQVHIRTRSSDRDCREYATQVIAHLER